MPVAPTHRLLSGLTAGGAAAHSRHASARSLVIVSLQPCDGGALSVRGPAGCVAWPTGPLGSALLRRRRWPIGGVTVQVDGRVQMSASTDAQPAEAIESLQVTIAPGDTDKVVDLMPGAATSVLLLVIKSTFYGDELTFTASGRVNRLRSGTLSSPQTYTGGSVALFGLDPNQLKFTNASADQSANVAIFVALAMRPPKRARTRSTSKCLQH